MVARCIMHSMSKCMKAPRALNILIIYVMEKSINNINNHDVCMETDMCIFIIIMYVRPSMTYKPNTHYPIILTTLILYKCLIQFFTSFFSKCQFHSLIELKLRT